MYTLTKALKSAHNEMTMAKTLRGLQLDQESCEIPWSVSEIPSAHTQPTVGIYWLLLTHPGTSGFT